MDFSNPVISIVTAVSLLLLLANLILFISKKIDFPFAIMLVLCGSVINFYKSSLPFLSDVELSQEVLLYIFLPILLFDSAFNIDFRKLRRDLDLVTTLSTLGIIFSALISGFFIAQVLNVPFAAALIVASVLTSTDPIAVVAIFKEMGVSKRLLGILDSESMLNDGTSVILTKLVISFFTLGFAGKGLLVGITDFGYIFIGSIALGAIIGMLTNFFIKNVKNDFLIEITLTLSAAFLGFLIAEDLFKLSGIITTVFVGLTVGNYGKDSFSPKVKSVVSEIWEYFSFIANSLIFLLVGIDYGIESIFKSWDTILLVYIGLMISRAAVSYPLFWLHNKLSEYKIPANWSHVIFWGGLRGALPITLIIAVISSTENAIFSESIAPYRESFINTTVGVVILSLLINGLTVKHMIKFLGVDKPTVREAIERDLIKTYILNFAIKRLKHLEKIGEITGKHRLLDKKFVKNFRQVVASLKQQFIKDPIEAKKAVYIYAFNTEKEVFIKLFEKGIISQKVLSKLKEKLLEGLDLIEAGIFPEDFNKAKRMQVLVKKSKRKFNLQELYSYRKAREFANLEVLEQFQVFLGISSLHGFIQEITKTYHKFYTKNKNICSVLEINHTVEISQYEEKLCYCEFIATEENIIKQLETEGKINSNTLRELQNSLLLGQSA